jgi:aldo/keto reductase
MEPVKGGMLATPPQPVMDIFKKADSKASAASWAIRYAADLEGVITVLSGMSNMEQMEDNISFMKDFVSLTAGERQVIAKAQEAMKNIPLIPCTACNYCAKVCPKNIGISGTFTAMNYLTLYDNVSSAKHQEEWLVGGHGMNNAAKCIKCGKCEQVCPQHIAIRSELSKAVKTLGLN